MPIGGHLNPNAAGQLAAVGWSVAAAPAAATQATASRAAAGATLRHVAQSVSGTVVGGPVAPAAQTLTLNLRDGATGAGTVLATWTLGVEAVAGKTVPFSFGPFAIPGSLNTVMTLEFSAAPGANTLESVVLAGYDSA